MITLRRPAAAALLAALVLVLAACAPKVGSERWCKAMQDKDKGNWTVNEAADFAKFCVLGVKPEG